MNNRLKQFLSAENISQSQFADTIKVVRASVSHVLSGRNNPGYDFIKAIMSAYPNLNMEWLMLGKGKMYKENFESEAYPPYQIEQEDPILFDDSDFKEPTTPLPEPEIPQATQSHSINNNTQCAASQRKVVRIMVFFDDGTYQEMGY